MPEISQLRVLSRPRASGSSTLQWISAVGFAEALASNLKVRNSLDVEEAFIDGSFAAK